MGGCIAKSVNRVMRVKRFFISIILYGYDDKKIFSSVLIWKNAYKLGLIPILIWYGGKVLFSGVFGTLTY